MAATLRFNWQSHVLLGRLPDLYLRSLLVIVNNTFDILCEMIPCAVFLKWIIVIIKPVDLQAFETNEIGKKKRDEKQVCLWVLLLIYHLVEKCTLGRDKRSAIGSWTSVLTSVLCSQGNTNCWAEQMDAPGKLSEVWVTFWVKWELGNFCYEEWNGKLENLDLKETLGFDDMHQIMQTGQLASVNAYIKHEDGGKCDAFTQNGVKISWQENGQTG